MILRAFSRFCNQMHGIEQTADGGLRIGALTTLAEIAGNETIRDRYAVLAEAAESAASIISMPIFICMATLCCVP